MKKVALLVWASIIVNTANAQFYFNGGLGYAFPQAGQSLNGVGTPYNGSRNNTTYLTTYNVKSASFSSGLQGAIGFGYMFSEHVGVQLDASVGLINTKYTFTDNNANTGGYQDNESTIMHANTPLILMPSVVVQTGGSSAWNLYSRWGLALPLNSPITIDQVIYIPSTMETYDITAQMKSSFSLGFTASAGVQYKINDKVTVSGSVSVLSLSLFVKQFTYKSATYQGQSVPLDSVISGPQTVKFSKNAAVDTNGAQYPAYSQPFSNLGVNIGISIRLSDKKYRKRSELIEDEDHKNFKRRRS